MRKYTFIIQGFILHSQRILIFQKVKDANQRTFYLQTCAERGWSRSALEEEIRFDSYSKRATFQNNFSVALNEVDISAHRLEFKDEYNLSFLGLEDVHTERQLENALIDNITKTLGQFGHNFTPSASTPCTMFVSLRQELVNVQCLILIFCNYGN